MNNFFLGYQLGLAATSPISLNELYNKLTDPLDPIVKQVEVLRNVQRLDKKMYQQMKAKLPWFIGANFKGPKRNLQDFDTINWLVIDIDDVGLSFKAVEDLKDNMKKDARLALSFISPSGRGLKCVYGLEKSLADPQHYSLLHKTFCYELAEHYQLDDKIDYSCSDATRVCFLSHDPKAFMNEAYEPLRLSDYISPSQTITANNKTTQPSINESQPTKNPPNSLTEDVYKKMIRVLNDLPEPTQKEFVTPDILNVAIPAIESAATSFGIAVVHTQDIQYGKKIMFANGHHKAEINLYYGKKGFSVVITPKSGMNKELAQVASLLVHKTVQGIDFNFIHF